MRGAAEFVKSKFDFPVLIAEVGVERGKNALDMLENMSISQIFLVDDYLPYTDYLGGFCPADIQEMVFKDMLERVKSFSDKVTVVNESSLEVVSKFADNYFDFVYIDGNHNYESVKRDMAAWLPKVKVGGVLGGHDFDGRGVTREDVTMAVKDFCKENDLAFTVSGEPPYADWIIVK